MKTGFIVHKADGMNHVFTHSTRGKSFLMFKVTLLVS